MKVKRLIVNADDLGRSRGVDRGILSAYRQGIVTSATLMTNTPDSADAAALARSEPRLGVGVHLVLTYLRPLSPPSEVPSLVRADGSFPPKPDQIRGRARADDALVEFRRQIDEAARLLGRAPTHLDTHHWVHDDPEVLDALVRVAAERSLPVREHSAAQRDQIRAAGVRTHDHFERGFHGMGHVTTEALVDVLRSLPDGTIELMCHPGELDRDLATSTYARERPLELAALIDPAAARTIRELGIELITFAQL